MSNRVNKTIIVCHTSFWYMLRIKSSFSWWLAHRYHPIQQGSRYRFTIKYKCCISRRAGLTTLNILLYKDNTFLFTISSIFSIFSALSKTVLCDSLLNPKMSLINLPYTDYVGCYLLQVDAFGWHSKPYVNVSWHIHLYRYAWTSGVAPGYNITALPSP